MLLKVVLTSSLLLNPISAITLNQYLGSGCSGAKRFCINIAPRVCCRSRENGRPILFASGDCSGCTSTDFQILCAWRGNSIKYCGAVAYSRNGGGCQGNNRGQGRTLRGHSWCRLCGTQAVHSEGTDESQCKETVAPNLMTKDDLTYFKIGEGVPIEDEMALEEWLASEQTVEEMPTYLMKYKVDFNATEVVD